MAKLSTNERARLAKALTDGGIKHVSHRASAEIEGARDDFHSLERLCADGFLRLDRIRGDRYHPVGERVYEYQLTEKGKREARRA